MRDTYDDFMIEFKKINGLDLTAYKENQMKRRILSFMNVRGHRTFTEFITQLKLDNQLKTDFFNHLTINVSEFFRDKKQWEILRDKVFPVLITESNGRPLRIWSAGCSSGQEPYSFAIMFLEHFPNQKVTIDATDIDKVILTKAKEGIYRLQDLRSLSPSIISKYFISIDGQFVRVKDSVKTLVRFKEQNLLKDSFERNYDLIACRNVVIYFTDEAKENLYRRFTESLKHNGILFTGSTEALSSNQFPLKPMCSFFYQK